MNAMQLLAGPVAQSIGWALLHLVWQATIVAGILAAVLALLPRQAANARYATACSALALVFAMFIATAVRSYDPQARPIVTQPAATAAPAAQTMTVSLAEVPALLAATATATWRERLMEAIAGARQSLPSIVALWLAGVVFLSARLLVSWLRVRRLLTRGASDAGPQWQRAATRLSDALGLRRAVRLLESAAVEVPSVLGTLRPVILLPASTLTGLTPEQIEMVLAHELAHIRRHDFLVNLMQAFVETLMFYHPAIWWMSRAVRIERENCCDDLAVAVCGNPIQYARALTRLEELRAGALPVVVAATGGSLLERIRRIALGRAESTSATSRWAAAVVMLAVLALALALPSLPALAQRDDDPPKKAEKAKPAKATVEVVEEQEGAPAPEAAAPEERAWRAAEADVDLDVEPPDVDLDLPGIPVAPIATPYVPATPRPSVSVAPMAVVAPVIAGTPVPGVPAPRAPRQPYPPMAAELAPGPFDYEETPEADDREEEKEKDFGESGKLTVDELIQLRAVGVTPEYISQMRAVYPDLKLRALVQLRAVGVTPEYVSEMRKAGFDMKSARELQSMRAVGVTGAWLSAMKAAGVDIKTGREATQLRAVGVTPELVKQLSAAGYPNLSVRELTRLAAVGIDGDFIRDMEKYRDKK